MATVVTNVGRAYVIDRIDGTSAALPNRIGWGTGAGTAAVTDTALFTESTETRATATLTQPTTTTSRAVGTLTAAGAGKTITNAGLLDAATGGTLIIHSDHAGVPLEIGDSIEYTFDLTD